MTLHSFFNPQSVAVVGVSNQAQKLGSVIFQNIIESGFQGDLYGINPKMEAQKIQGKFCFSSLQNAPQNLDLIVVVVPGKFVESVIDEAIEAKAQNIIVISAGFGEIGNHELEDRLAQKCEQAGIHLLGPNCLGALFPHAKINASFSDGYPLPGRICFVSQSGAFCTAMLDWAAEKEIGFSHFISLGNKAGISENDILEALKDDENVEIFAFYLESLKDGPRLLELIKKIAPHKPVIILEPGKSAKAAEAASSHTGSLAPNSRILEQAYRQAGAIQVFSMRHMFALLETLSNHPQKNFGSRIALLTNAGGVGVLSTDLSAEQHLNLASLDKATTQKLQEQLPAEANIKNPIDIIGDAKSDRYKAALQTLAQDPNTDQILVLLTPQRTTEIEATAQTIADLAHTSDKNIMACFIGGAKTSKGHTLLQKKKVPCFDFPVDALRIMGLLAAQQNQVDAPPENRTNQKHPRIDQYFKQHEGLPSLRQECVNDILEHYGFDYPRNCGFQNYNGALECASQFFPAPVVLKISSPSALHKTDLKGVILDVDNEEKFKQAWKALNQSIEKGDLSEAHIQVQEQIPDGTEVILGITRDPNFGPVMLFGSGGIYTEVFKDTALRVLPTKDFKGLIDETKVSKILQGVRGESPKAVDQLIQTMEKMQQLVLDYPEIKSIDANPVLMLEDRSVCVDFKILI